MESFTQLSIFLISVILLSRLSALLSNRVGFSSVSFQFLTGILIGPSLLNLLGIPITVGTWGSISPSPLHSILKILAEIGLVQLMFLAGLQINWHAIEADLKSILSLSLWGFILPAIVVTIVINGFVERWTEGLAIAAIMATGSLGISAYNFNEPSLFKSRAINMVFGFAILTGLLSILLMITVQAVNYTSNYGVLRMTIAVSWFLAKLIMFFAIAYFLTSRFLRLINRSTLKKRPLQALIGYLLLVGSIYAYGALHFGDFAAVFIASLGGSIMRMSNLGIKEKIGGFGSPLVSFPLGILFVVLGMEANFKGIENHTIMFVVLLLTVTVTKLSGTFLATLKWCKSFDERFRIMIACLPQGEIGMLIAAYLFSRGLIDPTQFNFAILVVVILTMITPILMKTTGYPSSLQSGLKPRVTTSRSWL